jgi:hypothetical protein
MDVGVDGNPTVRYNSMLAQVLFCLLSASQLMCCTGQQVPSTHRLFSLTHPYQLQ